MASIFDVSISVSERNHHDNKETYKGLIYYKKKIIGKFEQNFWDNKVYTEFNDASDIEKASKKYFDVFGFTQHKEVVPTINDFAKILLYLKAAEDVFTKNNNPVAMIVDNHDISIVLLNDNYKSEKDIAMLLKNKTENKNAHAFLFSSVDDFEIK